MSHEKHPLLGEESWLDPDEQPDERVESIIENLTTESFNYWYREWQYQNNIQEGHAYYNKTGYVPDPEHHSPSKLQQCQRKQYYNTFNAPKESEDPSGIFWTGQKYEEEIVMPYLVDMAQSINENNYVQNSMWVDFEIESKNDDTTLDLRGETDPVIVDRRGNPLLVTEVKNKRSLDKFDRDNPTPDEHHKAQIHAYMYGLSKSFERTVHQGLILYGSRETLELLPVPVTFDIDFWENKVVEWMSDQTSYRLDEELPPIDPAFSWECKFCDYAQRCGMGEDPPFYNDESDKYPGDPQWRDTSPDGFLPLTEYPLDHVVKYLRAHAPKGAKLTPTLANQYPMLTEKFGVYDWECPWCDTSYGVYHFDWDGNTANPPQCPECGTELRGPLPENQHD